MILVLLYPAAALRPESGEKILIVLKLIELVPFSVRSNVEHPKVIISYSMLMY